MGLPGGPGPHPVGVQILRLRQRHTYRRSGPSGAGRLRYGLSGGPGGALPHLRGGVLPEHRQADPGGHRAEQGVYRPRPLHPLHRQRPVLQYQRHQRLRGGYPGNEPAVHRGHAVPLPRYGSKLGGEPRLLNRLLLSGKLPAHQGRRHGGRRGGQRQSGPEHPVEMPL